MLTIFGSRAWLILLQVLLSSTDAIAGEAPAAAPQRCPASRDESPPAPQAASEQELARILHEWRLAYSKIARLNAGFHRIRSDTIRGFPG